MKNLKNNTIYTVIAALIACTSIACTGDRGPQGVAGPKGAKGDPGKDGKDGKNGVDGEDGQDGQDGNDGQDGTNGTNGGNGGNNGGTTGDGWTLCEYSSQMDLTESVALDIAEGVRDGESYTQNCGNPTSNNGNVVYVAVNRDSYCGSKPLIIDPQDNNWTAVVGYASKQPYTDSNTVSSSSGFDWVEVPILDDKGDCVVVFQVSNGLVNVGVGN